jgi:hypothetical protein
VTFTVNTCHDAYDGPAEMETPQNIVAASVTVGLAPFEADPEWSGLTGDLWRRIHGVPFPTRKGASFRAVRYGS